ncbi:hypothetical protein BU25DRAFT_453696 [Macroventuria anomochaeta]|uniref:Uncharacterized protein n=1 Tax=Macroventuria anomochaeta TaxID=301207 RepID=A0ACB6SIS6_9PLEO|nr:uncharacterized protein BU25DRAFT_453696 [Macroventuria anomochaeta]KAF2633994.1 hypothetical protein BU25DRAFT_453696 [Macroventuria anomochaeta]
MSQHKYNPRQIIFVKNVPQESTMRIACLYTQFKPLEVKNLYPDSRITTFMVALPNAGAAEEALRRTDGMKLHNTVITVERYNAKQSTVARRDARRKRKDGFWVNGNRCDTNEDYEGGYDADEEVQVRKDMPKSAKDVASQVLDSPTTPPRKVSTTGGMSWANVASGVPAEQHSPSPAPPVAEDTKQLHSSETEPFLAFDNDALPEGSKNLPPSSNGNGPSNLDTAHIKPAPAPLNESARCPPPLRGTFTSPVSVPAKPALVPAPPAPAGPLQITLTPSTASLGPHPPLPQPPSSSTPSPDDFYTALQNRTPTQPRSSKSSRVDKDSSQQTQVPNVTQQQRGFLASSTDTTAYIRNRHCADCALCEMRMQGRE